MARAPKANETSKARIKTLGARVPSSVDRAFNERAAARGVSVSALLHALINAELGLGKRETAADRRVRLLERLVQEMSSHSIALEKALNGGSNAGVFDTLQVAQDSTYRAILLALQSTKRGRRARDDDLQRNNIEDQMS